MIEEHGWAGASRELTQLIQAERDRREAEARTPRAIIANILANPTKYRLTGKPRMVLAAIGASPDAEMSSEELLWKIWGTRPSMIIQKDLEKLSSNTSRVNGQSWTPATS